MQPRARARHADVGHPPIPIVVDIGKSGEDDHVVFEALEAGDGGPGDGLEGRAAEVGDVVFREAAEAHALEVFVFVAARGLEEQEGDAARWDVVAVEVGEEAF